MKRKLLFALILIIFGFYAYMGDANKSKPSGSAGRSVSVTVPEKAKADAMPKRTVVASGLDTPWSLVFLTPDRILIAERGGAVKMLNGNIVFQVGTIQNATEIGEGGLLGMALHPDFDKNNFIYFYYTYSGNGENTLNRVSRYSLVDKRLIGEKIIIDSIPGARNHNGGRIGFGPDNRLYVTTGDAQEPSRSQDKKSLAGKILRITDDGKPAPGNPFGNEVYSYGHRNPQGIAWDRNGKLYSTEHGRSGLQSGLDEFNAISEGRNYGWPDIEGDEKGAGIDSPLLHSGGDTWAPASLAYLDGAFYFGGLRGQALYRITFSGIKPVLSQFFKGELGRIRDVIVGPDRQLYITTSNLDGRGNPQEGDDKIIRINPEKLKIL